LIWVTDSAPFNKAVVIAPSGDVVAFASRKLRLHAGHSGRLLAQQDTCFTFSNSFGFVDERSGALVCENNIKLYSFPQITYQGQRSLPGKARVAAFGGQRLAVGFAQGPVRVIATTDWRQIAEVAVDRRPAKLALSVDGRWLAVGFEDGRLVLHDLGSNKKQRLSPRRMHGVSALAFSRTGGRLFACAGPFVALFATETGELAKRFRVLKSVTGARWISEQEIATVGEDGLLILNTGDGSARSVNEGSTVGDRPAVVLDSSADGKVLCTGRPEGKITCYGRGRPSPPATSAPTVGARSSGITRTEGRLINHTGKRLVLKALAQTAIPPVGISATLLLHVHTKTGALTTSGWAELAKVRVVDVDKDVVRMAIVEDTSAGVLGASKGDPFGYDAPVRLVWVPR